MFTIQTEPCHSSPDNNVHVANMGPTWVLSAPGGPLVGPMNTAIREWHDINVTVVGFPHKGPVMSKAFPCHDSMLYSIDILWHADSVSLSIKKWRLVNIGIPIIKIRLSHDRIIFIIPIPRKSIFILSQGHGLEAAKFGVKIITSLWNFTSASSVILPRQLSNFTKIGLL